MNLSEHDYIEKIRHLIECRLEWKDSKDWKNRDYEYLSDLISGKTKVTISVSTLKRIWTENSLRIPHVSTLNALSMFIDYENWNDFKTRLRNDIRPAVSISEEKTSNKKYSLKTFLVVFSALVVLFTIYFFVKGRISQKDTSVYDDSSVLFTSKKTVTSGLPNSVVFNYDISGIIFDSAFIQQDWDRRKRAAISKENNFHTSIYYYPGYYTAKLVINDKVVKEHPLFITTDGWIAIYKKTYEQEIPVYLKNVDVIKQNRLLITPDDLKANKIENDKDYFIGFYNARDYGEVNCDSFSFETTIKNDPKDGGLTCQYSSITVEAEKGLMTAAFSEKGCTSKLFLMFGDVYVDGAKSDLSPFGTDLTAWRKIRYQVINKHVRIFLDNKEIYQLNFTRDIGKIINISYYFYGCGSVQMVKLWDRYDSLVYEEDFR